MEKPKITAIKLDEITYEKLRYIAQHEGRFISREAAWMVRQEIRKFEKEHGEIAHKTYGRE